jgi:hypothetical protein
LQINRYQGVLWFNHESFDQLLGWMLIIAAIAIVAEPEEADGRVDPREVPRRIVDIYKSLQQLQEAEARSGYQVEKVLEAAKI